MNSNSVILTKTLESNISLGKNAYLKLKRIFDICFGIVGVLAMLFLAFIIKAVSICNRDYNPIFFKQKRIGKDGKPFMMYKFRTMVPNADKILIDLIKHNAEFRNEFYENRKVEKDPRITKVGKILRKTSLDELPQFINILKGDMSLIGPRPVVPSELEIYGNKKDEFLSMKPGLTGYWQANGRNSISYDDRIKMELYYVRNYSMKFDIKIIKDTFISVIKKDGAM